MNIHKVYNSLNIYFRKKRMKRFIQELNVSETDLILDVGGTPYNWDIINIKNRNRITLLNLNIPKKIKDKNNFNFVVGDGRKLNYKDISFDIVFSNSVIEHLCSYYNQKKFAEEIRRVGKKLWIQTPNKYFFIEPHVLGIFIHWFSKKIQKKVIRYFTLWGLITRLSKKIIGDLLDEVRLLSYKEFKDLFPDCKIYKEKFMGFSKSFIAIRK